MDFANFWNRNFRIEFGRIAPTGAVDNEFSHESVGWDKVPPRRAGKIETVRSNFVHNPRYFEDGEKWKDPSKSALSDFFSAVASSPEYSDNPKGTTESTIEAIRGNAINSLLEEWKSAVRDNDPERRQLEHEFIDACERLRLNVKSLLIRVQFDPEDVGSIDELKEKLGAQPLDEAGLIYDLHILTPRRASLEKAVSPHGSPVREQLYSQGEIRTLKLGTFQNETIVIINPMSIGALSVDKSKGEYPVSPLELSDIQLRGDLPPYLNDEQKNWVENFYQSLQG